MLAGKQVIPQVSGFVSKELHVAWNSDHAD